MISAQLVSDPVVHVASCHSSVASCHSSLQRPRTKPCRAVGCVTAGAMRCCGYSTVLTGPYVSGLGDASRTPRPRHDLTTTRKLQQYHLRRPPVIQSIQHHTSAGDKIRHAAALQRLDTTRKVPPNAGFVKEAHWCLCEYSNTNGLSQMHERLTVM